MHVWNGSYVDKATAAIKRTWAGSLLPPARISLTLYLFFHCCPSFVCKYHLWPGQFVFFRSKRPRGLVQPLCFVSRSLTLFLFLHLLASFSRSYSSKSLAGSTLFLLLPVDTSSFLVFISYSLPTFPPFVSFSRCGPIIFLSQLFRLSQQCWTTKAS